MGPGDKILQFSFRCTYPLIMDSKIYRPFSETSNEKKLLSQVNFLVYI